MIEIARELATYDDVNLIYVGAAQEEIGGFGAEKVAKDLKSKGEKIDLAISMDCINFYPENTPKNKMGGGVILLKKPEPNEQGVTKKDRDALNLCYNVAKDSGVNYQEATCSWSWLLPTTEAEAYHSVNNAASLLFGIRCQNMHGYADGEKHKWRGESPVGGTHPERIDLRDVADTVELTTRLVKAYSKF